MACFYTYNCLFCANFYVISFYIYYAYSFLKNTYDDNDRGVDNVDKWWMGADCEGDVLVDKWMKTC